MKKRNFQTHYCLACKQIKVCGTFAKDYCCFCFCRREQEKSQDYLDYSQTYQQESKNQRQKYQQLLLLKNYDGCSECQSKMVDAYELYENSRLVCQPCLVRKTGGSSSPISFSEKAKWYKRWWKIDLVEWLENYGCLPINAECAEKWLKDRVHLKHSPGNFI